MPFIRVNGELAEIVPTVPGRAKLVYLACEPGSRRCVNPPGAKR